MSSDSESDDFVMMTPPEIKNSAQEVINNLLPEKSRAKYDKIYNDFILWKSSKNAQPFSENVLLSYFSEKAQKYKPSTLWSTYSMLKSSLSVKNNVNIKEYAKLTAFLKRKSEGFRIKKSKVLTTKDVFDFLQNAPDNNYLLMKNQWGVMSEYCREQHPLLCEEASEEELYSPRYFRRVHPINYRGRSRINHKGAANILSRWPDHWSSFLTYWWIAIGMISLMTFIIYNSLFAFSMLPSTNTTPVNSITTKESMTTSLKKSTLPDVYLHIFADTQNDVNLNQYVPYVDVIARTFLDFKFNFFVLINDTNVGWMSAEENNELALNTLWTRDKYVYQRDRSRNINIEFISLSVFLDSSPIRKYWRMLPHHLVEFLARTVSIWDKGGIAVNPEILTPTFQQTLYVEKLQMLLNKYAKTNEVISDFNAISKINNTPKNLKKINNIRDIIDALEKEDISANAYARQTLSEAENRDVDIIRHERKISLETKPNYLSNSNLEPTEKIVSDLSYSTTSIPNQAVNNTNTDSLKTNHNSSKIGLLPLLFMEFLFHNKDKSKTTEPALVNRTRKSIINSNAKESLSKNVLKETENDTVYQRPKPVFISSRIKSEFNNFTTTTYSNESEKDLELNILTIDLKGNLIATDTACHAFLGTIYSNLVHPNQEETITDFIIAELSIFCKGLLSSCIGIDLILI